MRLILMALSACTILGLAAIARTPVQGPPPVFVTPCGLRVYPPTDSPNVRMAKVERDALASLDLTPAQLHACDDVLNWRAAEMEKLAGSNANRVTAGLKILEDSHVKFQAVLTPEHYKRFLAARDTALVAAFSVSSMGFVPTSCIPPLHFADEQILANVYVSESQWSQYLAGMNELTPEITALRRLWKRGEKQAVFARCPALFQRKQALMKRILSSDQHAEYVRLWTAYMSTYPSSEDNARETTLPNGLADLTPVILTARQCSAYIERWTTSITQFLKSNSPSAPARARSDGAAARH